MSTVWDDRVFGREFLTIWRKSPFDREIASAPSEAARHHAKDDGLARPELVSALDRVCKLLWFAYDTRPWWKREVWDPQLDPRIPHTAHELQNQTAIHWHRLNPPWLRDGSMFFIKSQLELGRMRWSTALGFYWGLSQFGRFLEMRGVQDPRLVADSARLRPFLLEYVVELRRHVPTGGRAQGPSRSRSSVAGMLSKVRQLYAFMCDFGREAAEAVDDSRWADIFRNYDYLRLWRSEDLPLTGSPRFDERHLISDDVMASIAAHAHLLGAPKSEGGLGDEQAMRILLLMMATGRRVNEICRLDLEPIIPVEHGSDEEIAKLRYQQTKIEGAPDTIFVGQEVIAIVAEQQAWLREKYGKEIRPNYLFTRYQSNLRGEHAYKDNQLRNQFKKLVQLTDLTELDGTPLRLSQTHRFRHTKATSLINAGVALHVVQRYMGHLTPEMTMHYAQTLDSTAKAEFLRYRKVTREGTQSSLSPDDLYDLMALDKHTDRVLPNGWCTLPPAKTCGKGNACLTCDLFVTDARFLSVHEGEIVALDQLVESRQEIHRERTGQPMSENHVWLTLRRRERRALETIVDTLKRQPAAESNPIRGAGADARDAPNEHDNEETA